METRDDILKELREIAPKLASLEKKNLYETPQNYFIQFSQTIKERINTSAATDELEVFAPALSKLEKEVAAEIPAAYFNSFPDKVLRQIKQQQKAAAPAPKWVQSLNEALDNMIASVFKPKYSVAFAGITTMVVITVMLFTKIQSCDDLDCKLAQLTNEEINTYLDNKSDSYSDEIFESNLEGKSSAAFESSHAYTDALSEMDDAALEQAINN